MPTFEVVRAHQMRFNKYSLHYEDTQGDCQSPLCTVMPKDEVKFAHENRH